VNQPHATRVLPASAVTDLDDYVGRGGGQGIDAAWRLGPEAAVEHLAAAGLRGRGGAGFPTARKWAAVRAREASAIPATVVVNAAEGEPGSFKDRAILRRNPFAVLEGALIAAATVDADRVVVAVKESFTEEAAVLRRAVAQLAEKGWTDGVAVGVFEGPGAYLYGEETGLLEVLDGRHPFPRVAPPYRYGLDEVPPDEAAPPALVNNVETLANVAGIVANGPDWFREVGTPESPGTVVCTVSGAVEHAGVAEVAMGTPLLELVDDVGGGARRGHQLVAAMSGVANPLIAADRFDTPMSHEAMEAIGSGLGAAGFIVFDDDTDFAALAHAVSRFLAVESCGQCVPCKEDGVALMEIFDRVRRSEARDDDLVTIDDHLRTITDGARCYLATQHQLVIASIRDLFGNDLRAHTDRAVPAAAPLLVAPITSLDAGIAELDERQLAKQPDWSFDMVDSGKSPADRFEDPQRRTGRAQSPAPSPARDDRPPVAPARSRDDDVDTRAEHPVDTVEDDPEAPLYSSVPLETDEGVVVVQQQNVGPDNEEGGGEWPDPDASPRRPAPGASRSN
jgi:NADH:ubiquinone oxidoreductase subunit F (NADH-binding)